MRRLLSTRPGWGQIALAALLGALMALGQAPLGAWWLTLPALGLLIAVICRAGVGAAWLGWFAGAGYFAAAMFWIVEPFLINVARHGWMAPFALVFLSFGMALFWAAAAGIGVWLGGPFAVALALAGVELLRGYVLTGFPWALIGHVWIDTPVAQLAALIGPVGLTLGTLVLAALPVWRRWAVVVSVALLAAGWGWGAWRLAQPAPADQGVTVRVVQPNAPQHLKWDPEMAWFFFDRLLELTAEPAEADAPDIVVWPETAVPFLLDSAPEALAAIARASGGAPVALGVQRMQGTRAYNSIAMIGQGGSIGPVYDKHHLVPFGEYIPFGDVMGQFGIHGFAAREGMGFSAGLGATVLDLGVLGRVLPLICYEAVFPQDLRAAPERADWILQATNDAWFGALAGPQQHLAQARLRAVEQGLPLIRAANTGVSAVIDARGRMVAQLGLDTHGFLDARVPGALPATPYARSGDWPVGFIIAAGLLAALLTRRRHKH